MCSPSTPKAPPKEKPKPLRILLSRDRFGKTGDSGSGAGSAYMLPPQKGGGHTNPGGPTAPGLNLVT